MKKRIGFGAALLLAGSALLVPALEARQCSGNGDVVGSYGFTGSRSGFYLLGATAAGANSPTGLGPMIPVPVQPAGTAGNTGTTGTVTTSATFVGSNTAIGNLLTGLGNPNVFSSVGRVFADGMGNLYASPTTGLMSNVLAGSYNVTTSCSITMTLTDPFLTSSTAGAVTNTGAGTGNSFTLNGYVTGTGNELDMYGSNGAVVTFLKTSQGGNCNNSSLSGTFTATGQGFYTASAGNGLTTMGSTGGTTGTTTGVGTTTTGPMAACMIGTTASTGTGTSVSSGTGTSTGTGTGTGQTAACTGAFTSGATGTLGTPFTLLARFVADGAGNLTTDSSGLAATSAQGITGSYSVNTDCTGTAHLVDEAGIARNISFILVNQAAQCYIGAAPQSSARQELEFVFSDPGVMGGGVAQLQ
jgi:hypothetical protein